MPASPRAGGRRRLGGLPPYHFGRFRASSFPIFRASSGGLIFVLRPTNPDCHGRELMTHKGGARPRLCRVSRGVHGGAGRAAHPRTDAPVMCRIASRRTRRPPPPTMQHRRRRRARAAIAAAKRVCPLRGDGGLCYPYNDGGRVPPAYNVGHRRARHADIVSDNGYLSDGRICRYLSPHPAHQRRVVFAAARRGHPGKKKAAQGRAALWRYGEVMLYTAIGSDKSTHYRKLCLHSVAISATAPGLPATYAFWLRNSTGGAKILCRSVYVSYTNSA